MKLMLVVGTRPNFVKIAPLERECQRLGIQTLLVHTGQHYDANMSKVFFEDLMIRSPDINLSINSDSPVNQIAEIMHQFSTECNRHKPSMVVVVGDVNSTLACALVANKMNIPLAHVEAGLRSYDKSMPEEVNRVITDSISDILFTPSPDANHNLLREGIPGERIHLVGNISIDSLLHTMTRINSLKENEILSELPAQYGLVTLHRASNVDVRATLESLISSITQIAMEIPLIFPLHPRTRKNLAAFNLLKELEASSAIQLYPPLGYMDFLSVLTHATFIMTDSGGVQEESTVFGIPCLTLRHNTERPITVVEGCNRVVGTDPACIKENWMALKETNYQAARSTPPYWDGKVAERIITTIREYCNEKKIY